MGGRTNRGPGVQQSNDLVVLVGCITLEHNVGEPQVIFQKLDYPYNWPNHLLKEDKTSDSFSEDAYD